MVPDVVVIFRPQGPFFLFLILLKHSRHTTLCSFLPYSKVIQVPAGTHILLNTLFHEGSSQEVEYSPLCSARGP